MYEEYDQQVLNAIRGLIEANKPAKFREILEVTKLIISINPGILKYVPLSPMVSREERLQVTEYRRLDRRLQALKKKYLIAYNAKTQQWRIIE